MESGLLYIAAVIVILAVGFFFALFMSMFAIREADRSWPQDLLPAVSPDEAAHTEGHTPVSAPLAPTSASAH
jgi:hypothetical protein